MKNRNWYASLTIVLLVSAAALYATSHFSRQSISCDGCNLIIIGIDTLRADRVHAFGYEKDTTPNLDKLISEGYAFTNAISPSSWTVPSFMSIMTGVYPSVHKVTNKYAVFNAKEQVISNLQELSPGMRTLAEVMRKAGYATGGFTGDAGVGGQFGYKSGFDVYTDEKAFGSLENSQRHAIEWLDSLPKDQKFFMFFHGYDLHGQFDIPKELQRFVPLSYTGKYTGAHDEEAVLREAQLRGPISHTEEDVGFWNGLYDSKIRAADGQLGAFLAEIEKRGLSGNTIIVVVSDHGEEWFEHGGIDHGHALYDELVHVPLVIKMPKNGKATISAQVSTMDIAQTVLELLAINDEAFASQTQGLSLVSYMTGGASAGRDIFLETDYRDFIHLRGMRSADGWMYVRNIVNKNEELYDLKADPQQKNNLIAQESEKTKELRDSLFSHIKDTLHADPLATPSTGCLPVYPTECLELVR